MTWQEMLFWESSTFENLHAVLNKSPYLPENPTRAYELTPLAKVRAVILGQDPYPTPGHANGLAFSVNPDVKPYPASLRNIFKEYNTDLGYDFPSCGDLTPWAEEGVLLLNSCLTVTPHNAGSHRTWGWEELIKETIQTVHEYVPDALFILWGNDAKIVYSEALGTSDFSKSPVIFSRHPSPYSASDGFFGSRPFSRANEYLRSSNLGTIDWKLP